MHNTQCILSEYRYIETYRRIGLFFASKCVFDRLMMLSQLLYCFHIRERFVLFIDKRPHFGYWIIPCESLDRLSYFRFETRTCDLWIRSRKSGH
jgi:hypothetical protein